VALGLGQVWGGITDGVEQEQLSIAVEAEVAWRRFGLFLNAPLVVDTAYTTGIYGDGAASVIGAGDLGFGIDVLIGSWRGLGIPWSVGAGTQLTAPTGGSRRVEPETPLLAAPFHEFGPSKWTASLGAGLVTRPAPNLHLQLNADLVAHLRDDRDTPGQATHWLFGALALSCAADWLDWLVPMVGVDLQLELRGRTHALRQLIFISPALRLRPRPWLTVDLGLRAPVRQETRDEHRLSLGLTVGIVPWEASHAP
jgi:hypothetical protein